ncbi:hypothetical protein NMK71_05450 [Weeksellaceae bacterium KMM 9713]|uniref:Uncharacterized protein n=1 Tax=Profundicola chukchiensis TaxID=2961959 RepID=A0A9X4RWJ3_9FLAO|nr:hypothetical protein [Profundicola chukchiensis]MDG4945852.1 hypothetical protein [Profundicola chukchiensis]
MTLDKFKERFELLVFISVYLGYLIQIIIFAPPDGILIFLGIFALAMILFLNIMFSYPLVIVHHLIYFMMISDLVGYENYEKAITINTIFFLPFYVVLIYTLISLFMFDLDSRLEKILKNIKI